MAHSDECEMDWRQSEIDGPESQALVLHTVSSYWLFFFRDIFAANTELAGQMHISSSVFFLNMS